MAEPARILMIDDSEDDRFLYKRCLQKSEGANYAVSEAANGEDGLASLDKESFACILLDYSLPGRNGVEILKRIRVKHPFVAVVMLTARATRRWPLPPSRKARRITLLNRPSIRKRWRK